jgi:two-component system sensor histidine kinase DctS
LAHSARITLKNSAGTILAQRDANVVGGNLYLRKIATLFVDRTLYLNVNSSQGTPFLIPNLLALSAACLSLLLVWSVYALWRDLAKRSETEAALRAQQALQTAMENSLVTGLRARDMSGRITYANPAFCEMVGYSLGEIRSFAPPMKYWAAEVRENAQGRYGDAFGGQGAEQPLRKQVRQTEWRDRRRSDARSAAAGRRRYANRLDGLGSGHQRSASAPWRKREWQRSPRTPHC